jgi:hypothetical protein
MLTITIILALAALIVAILSVVRPALSILWVAVVLLAILELVRSIPVGR